MINRRVPELKRALLAVAFGVTLLPGCLSAYNISTLDWVSSGNNLQGNYYVSPYTAQIRGTAQQLALYCIDFNHEVSPPNAWNAIVEPFTFSNFSTFQYASLGTPAGTWDKYLAAAWLIDELTQVGGNTSHDQYQKAVFQFAAWRIFVDNAHMWEYSQAQAAVGGGAFSSEVTAAYNDAFNAVHGGYSALGWQIVAPYPAGNEDSVQEFLVPGTPAPTPEPASIILMGTALVGAALMLKRRNKRTGRE
jgi:PEP-CTERM motif